MADERDRTASERGQVPAENAHAAGGREGSADALEQLSTRELHDRAVRRAERHLDVRFFWSLLQMIPAAEAASGDQGEAAYDVQHAKGVILDVLTRNYDETLTLRSARWDESSIHSRPLVRLGAPRGKSVARSFREPLRATGTLS